VTLQKLATKLAKLEGKKVEVSIGNIREVLKLLVQLEVEARIQLGVDLPSEVIQALNEAASKKAAKKLLKAKGALHE
jgi:hypothetical protein